MIADGVIDGEKVLLVKPQTYMNLSGQSIGGILRFHKLSPDNLLVIHDELDLPAGKVRIKKGGSAGGHNGLKSIDGHCGKDYRRLRLGIGHPGHKDMVHHYVLGNFAKADEAWLEPLLDAISDHMPLLLKGEDSTFMNRLTAAVGDSNAEAKPEKKARSHIRAARPSAKPALPQTGPMTDMLKKLFSRKPDRE
ncbi:MAG: Peptidyl-tRNA hydrolase [Candidatus Tokpelaia hoelldobleri]|uniref:Peptidyl-tRNA hydrolase n=1 Tax=Candidatus Tokpelaia hoelldobleri TaxID=1902579 RepID=A0A1U9JVI9_9HYPH|nr:MAG: Peptidyl-tRNA hydrolase [Candidatus Tokpelaia hoelldoblerii]